MIATNKHQQLILLEPERADMLQALSKRINSTKQELLREAVDLLLAKYGATHVSHELDAWRASLEMSYLLLGNARQVELPPAVDGTCTDVQSRIWLILTEWGVSKEKLHSYDPNPPIGANSHKAKRARAAKK